MRSFRALGLFIFVSLVASCALLTRTYQPPHAPKSEAEKVKFPWGTPRQTVVLSSVWLRATTMALDDFLPAEAVENAKGEGEETECLARRENYFVEAWVWSPRQARDAADGGAPDMDGGSSAEADSGFDQDAGCCDAGEDDPWAPPGMPKAPPLIYVTVGLLPGRCELGGSPLLDMGAVYAIDAVNWRILAVHH